MYKQYVKSKLYGAVWVFLKFGKFRISSDTFR